MAGLTGGVVDYSNDGVGLIGWCVGDGLGWLFVCCVWCVSAGCDEPESLILAQSERWRHA